MRYRSIRESSWKGMFYTTVECSNCGQLLHDVERRNKPVFCPHCAHKLSPLPIRVSYSKIVDALNDAAKKEAT